MVLKTEFQTIGFTDNWYGTITAYIRGQKVGKLRAFQANVLDATVITITNYLVETPGIFATTIDTKAPPMYTILNQLIR